MMKAQCHCGNIMIEVANPPTSLTSCNCSICNRLGALWAYYAPEDALVNFRQGPTSSYKWGNGALEFHHCPTCGCTTHYATTEQSKNPRIAINARMMDAKTISDIPIRQFDGAVSWRYIDG